MTSVLEGKGNPTTVLVVLGEGEGEGEGEADRLGAIFLRFDCDYK